MRSLRSIWPLVVLASASLGIYIATAPPSIVAGDSGEFVVTLSTLGVSHPPGYPLYHLMGKALLVVLGFLPAVRVTDLFSSLAAVATLVAVCFLLTSMGVRRRVAIVGAAALAVSRIFWHFAIVTEVYALNLLFFALIGWLAATWRREDRTRRLYLILLLMGLSLTHHTTIVIYFPLYLGLLVAGLRGTVPTSGAPASEGGADALSLRAVGREAQGFRASLVTVAKALALFLAPLALYAYLPLASARHPVMDWGTPDTLKAVIGHITAAQYRQLLFEYGWRGYIDGLRTAMSILVRDCHVFLGLAVVGAMALGRERRLRHLVVLAGSILVCILVSSAYGIVDIEPYFLPAILAIYILGVVGIDRLAAWVLPLRRTAGTLAVVAAAALAAANLALNLPTDNLAHSWTARDFGVAVYGNLVSESDKPIVLYVRGDDMSFTMLYLGEVEKVRPDVTLVGENFVLNPAKGPVDPSTFEIYYSSPTRDAVSGYKLVTWGLVFRVLPENDKRAFERFNDIHIRGITDGPAKFAAGDLDANFAGVYYYQQGGYYLAHGDRARALGSFARAAEVNGTNPNTLYNLGLIYEQINEWERAREVYSRVAEARSYTLIAKACRNRMIFANFMLSRYNPAHEEVRLTEYAAMLFKNSALSEEFGSAQDAIAALRQAISINPGYVEAYLALGNIYTALKLYDEAYVILNEAARLDPDDPVVGARLGELQRLMGGAR